VVLTPTTREIDTALLDHRVSGVGLADGARLGELLDGTTLLVFLRHFG